MENTNEATHSRGIGYLMWVFGFMGMHRFYYGKPVSGVIWMLTGGLFLIGWIVDLFLIPSMAKEAAGRYARGPYDYSLAWVLQLFLGVFGIHRFYLGKVGTGLIWLLSGGLLGLGLIYDFCTLNTQVDERNRGATGIW